MIFAAMCFNFKHIHRSTSVGKLHVQVLSMCHIPDPNQGNVFINIPFSTGQSITRNSPNHPWNVSWSLLELALLVPTLPPAHCTLGSPGLPEHGSWRKFKTFAKAALRDSRLCYKMTGKSEPHPDSQSEAPKIFTRAETGTEWQDLHSILQPQALQWSIQNSLSELLNRDSLYGLFKHKNIQLSGKEPL